MMVVLQQLQFRADPEVQLLANTVHIQVKSAEGEVLHEHTDHNDIADDILVWKEHILRNNQSNQSNPYCFLLPDGPAWAGYTFNRLDPWAPYCMTLNRTMDTNADTLYAGHATPVQVGNTWKLFYKWTKLPLDLTLKAIGLMDWEGNGGIDGAYPNNATIFNPMTLLILSSPLTIKGRLAGAQTPDTLEVTYYIGMTGVQ